MKVECLKSDFCTQKSGKKWQKQTLGEKKLVLEPKEMDFQQVMFLCF